MNDAPPSNFARGGRRGGGSRPRGGGGQGRPSSDATYENRHHNQSRYTNRNGDGVSSNRGGRSSNRGRTDIRPSSSAVHNIEHAMGIRNMSNTTSRSIRGTAFAPRQVEVVDGGTRIELGRTVERSESSTHDQCVICCNEAEYFCIGSCNHAVCFECGIRLRVICKQNSCSICRADMDKVWIVTEPMKPSPTIIRNFYCDRWATNQHGFTFETEDAITAFKDLLAHVCTLCPNEPEFNTFNLLSAHMRRDHQMHYCELCVDHLTLFSWERKCYERKDLARHRREGDRDDQSYECHPQCEFCDTRFFDGDILYRHLRIDHYFCHICEADGDKSPFYDQMVDLRGHFAKNHHVCVEDNCVEDPFAVYRSLEDLKSHKAMHHGRQGKRGERVIDIEFTYNDNRRVLQALGDGRRDQISGGRRGRGAPGGQRGGPPGQRGGGRGGRGGRGGGGFPTQQRYDQQQVEEEVEVDDSPSLPIEPPRAVDFPSLEGGSSNSQQMATPSYGRHRGLIAQESDFPALPTKQSRRQKIAAQDRQDRAESSSKSAVDQMGGMRMVDEQEDHATVHRHSRHGGVGERREKEGEEEHIVPEMEVREEVVDGEAEEETPNDPPMSMFQQLTAGGWGANKSLRHVGASLNNPFPSLSSSSASNNSARWSSKARPKFGESKVGKLTTPRGVLVNGIVGDERKAPTKSSFSLGSMVTVRAARPIVNRSRARQVAAHNQRQSMEKVAESLRAMNDDEYGGTPSTAEEEPEEEVVMGMPPGLMQAQAAPANRGPPEPVVQIQQRPQIPQQPPAPPRPLPCEHFPSLSSSQPLAPPPSLTPYTAVSTKKAAKPSKAAQRAPPPQLSTLKAFDEDSLGDYTTSKEFKERNARLFDSISRWLSKSTARTRHLEEGRLDAFKTSSRQFRHDEIDAQGYYDKILDLLGQGQFNSIFDELLTLLPSIKLQRALLKVHVAKTGGKTGNKESANSPWANASTSVLPNATSVCGLLVCKTCGQVMVERDYAGHMTCHTKDQHFPTLGS